MGLSQIDRDAMQRAIDSLQRRGEIAQIERAMKCGGFECAGKFASYSVQCDTLRLKPWQAPPAHVHADATPHPAIYGCRPGEIALRDRLVAAGLSIYEPDPVKALSKAKTKVA
jgi:hypothetical protein